MARFWKSPAVCERLAPVAGRKLLPTVTLPLLVVLMLVVWREVPVPMKLLPAGIGLTIWAVFQISLRRGATPLVERFARKHYTPMPARVRSYCRRATWVWALVLFANGAFAAILALFAAQSAWALYTGLISYLVIGAVAFVERFLTRPRLHAQVKADNMRTQATEHMNGVQLEAVERGEDWLAARVVLADPSPLCAGHFPTMPVLPGFAQLLLIPMLWNTAHGARAALVRVERARFRATIAPGDVLRLELRGSATMLRFALTRDRERIADGTVVLTLGAS